MQTKEIDGILHVRVMPGRGGWVPAPGLSQGSRPGRFKVRAMGMRPPVRAVASSQRQKWLHMRGQREAQARVS
jgi:hypothetical protein